MIVVENSILELIPQRPPMVMVDRLLHCDEAQTVTALTIRENMLFSDNGHFSAAGLIENMAQTAAARIGWLMKENTAGKDIKPPAGVIGSVKNFRLHFNPAVGSDLVTTIHVEHEMGMATVVTGKVEIEGQLAAEAELQIFLTDDQSRMT
jgi:3-hydroxymyristoyl/3-hydroxydecanoyl-(acyl carrier protein) dehydratase